MTEELKTMKQIEVLKIEQNGKTWLWDGEHWYLEAMKGEKR